MIELISFTNHHEYLNLPSEITILQGGNLLANYDNADIRAANVLPASKTGEFYFRTSFHTDLMYDYYQCAASWIDDTR